ncbi:hypothetical protein KUTeg_014524 [Tegillarca granosa]|uniref:Uncharacterized protein n=1 Tax=Tegillarca granosa TaxID=220873 RepID=A0ABQ9ERS9_TEGGR|nr:hypothetical protein KUTeg_014524 [Tegillarca granosa]
MCSPGFFVLVEKNDKDKETLRESHKTPLNGHETLCITKHCLTVTNIAGVSQFTAERSRNIVGVSQNTAERSRTTVGAS